MWCLRNTLLLVILSFTITSCINSENKALLVGSWKGAEWLIEDRPSNVDVQKVHFTFTRFGGYNSDIGGSNERGTYILRDNKLYTTAEGQLEIMVEIKKLTKDSLVFNMNRSGQSETLTLIKE